MALYAIGDLHLSFTSNKDMSEYDSIWKDHDKKIMHNFESIITDDDTVVITGDHTWGGHLSTCMDDLEWIAKLPGRKIMLRGNHDIFWQVKKTKSLNEIFEGKFLFLQNNFYTYKDVALVGSKGYCYEPWDWHDKARERADGRYRRELKRVRTSIELARQAGYEKMILFLHYPPTEVEPSGSELGGRYESCFTQIAKEFKIETIVYSHLHGSERFADSLIGDYKGISYKLVSSDYLDFMPIKLMD